MAVGGGVAVGCGLLHPARPNVDTMASSASDIRSRPDDSLKTCFVMHSSGFGCHDVRPPDWAQVYTTLACNAKTLRIDKSGLLCHNGVDIIR